MDEMKEV